MNFISEFGENTIIDLLQFRVSSLPDQKAYTYLLNGETEGASFTYRALGRRVQAIAAFLQQKIPVGERVLLLYPQGIEYVAAFLGCLSAEVIAVPIFPPDSSSPKKQSSLRIQAIAHDARPRLALTTTRFVEKCEKIFYEMGLGHISVMTTDTVSDDRCIEWQKPLIEKHALAFLQYTSGSTSVPKGVMVSHANLLANFAMMQEALDYPGTGTIVSWLPLYHDMGLIGHALYALYTGDHCVLLPPAAFLQKPIRWLEAISRYRAYMSGGPNFAFDLCARKVTSEQLSTLDLSCWKVAVIGSEPIRDECMQRFSEMFAACGFAEATFLPGYGLAEATLFASSVDPEERPVVLTIGENASTQEDRYTEKKLVGCGRSRLEGKIAIVHPESHLPCRDGVTGEIWVGGPHVTQGYWGRAEETHKTFQAYLANHGEGPFLRTGDLGFFKDGHVYITGRLKDLIILRGVNYYPQDIEKIVEQCHPKLCPLAGVAFSVPVKGEERLVVVQEVERHCSQEELEEAVATIRRCISEQHELSPYTVVLIKLGSIPKTTSGKLQHHETRQRFIAGTLNIVYQNLQGEKETDHALREKGSIMLQMLRIMPEAGHQAFVESYIQIQIARLLGVQTQNIDWQQPISALGWDSLKIVELKNQIETELGILVSIEELLGDITLTQMAQKMLGFLNASPYSDASSAAEIMPVSPDDLPEPDNFYPLSSMQQGLWFLHQLKPESIEYNLSFRIHISGPLQITRLEKCLQTIMQRHPILQAVIMEEDGQLRIGIQADETFHLPGEELLALPDEGHEDAVQRRAFSEAQRPFDLAAGPLCRFLLLQLAEDEYVLLFNVHHIILDGWSLGIFLRELTDLYEASENGRRPVLPELAFQYNDYTVSQQEWLKSDAYIKQLSYWQKQLADTPVLLNLPIDHPRPPLQTFHGARTSFEISSTLFHKLKRFSQQEHTTVFTTLMACFQLLLARYSGQKDIVVGTPVSGRTRARTNDVIGLFVNTLAIRTVFSHSMDFSTVVKQVKTTILAAYAHQDVPFDRVVEAVQPARNLSHSPLFQVLFTMQNVPIPTMQVGKLTFTPAEVTNGSAQFDLSLSILETPVCLCGNIDYNTDLFEIHTIQRLIAHLQHLLAAILEHPDQNVTTVPFLMHEEILFLLQDRHQQIDLLQHVGIHDLITTQAHRTPAAIAICDSSHQISYEELEHSSSQMAHLLSAKGVSHGTHVAVCMERGVSMLIAILGIFKAGGVYIPLDPAYPAERLSFMLSDAQVSLLLVSNEYEDIVPLLHVGRLNYDTLDLSSWSPNFQVRFNLEQTAYIIYTSGSTGKPKGVVIGHRAAMALLSWAQERYSPQEVMGTLAITSQCFDLSIFEFFVPLVIGGTVVIVRSLWDFLEHPPQWPVTLINTVPSVFSQILNAQALPSTVQTVNLAGEPLSLELVQQIYHYPTVQKVYNLYGPSEDTTYSTWSLVPKTTQVQPVIGLPVADTQCYVLDDLQQLLPLGVIGELYLTGSKLAQGYFERPDLTAERFIPHPWSKTPGACLYRTGDLVRYRSDGNLEYIGRLDHQIKWHGYRIELGEIETALREYVGVREAIVVMSDGPERYKKIVAYVVSEQDTSLSLEDMRAFLLARLPSYMVPAIFMALDVLPLSPNGKVDRKALPVPQYTQVSEESNRPCTPVEKAIQRIWMDILKHEQVELHDNFFLLGGHSLLATSVISHLQAAFQIRLPITLIFLAPTVAELAEHIEQALLPATPGSSDLNGTTSYASVPISMSIPRLEQSRYYPLSATQQGIWFLEQLAPDSLRYTMSFALRMTGILDVVVLEKSLSEIIQRHEILRTLFPLETGRPVQMIMPAQIISLRAEKLTDLAMSEWEERLRQIISLEAHQPFDLEHGPLLRIRLFQVASAEHVLLLNMHHLISDGWSMSIFVQELVVLYEALRQGQSSPLTKLPIQYGDFAAWQQQYIQEHQVDEQLSYWKQQLSRAPRLLQLPTDYPRPAVQTFQGTQHMFFYPISLQQRLREFSQREDVTLFMLLLTAFNVLLMRYSGQKDIIVGTPIAGRTYTETEAMIGLFINTLALRSDLSGNPSFHTLLQHVRQTTIEGYLHQDVPFHQVIDAVQPERNLSHTPLFQVVLALQNVPLPQMQMAGLQLTPIDVTINTAKYDLIFSFVEVEEGLKGIVEYNTDLFAPPTIERLVAHLHYLLEAALENPQQGIEDLPLWSKAEAWHVVEQMNASADTRLDIRCLHELFEDQVMRTPAALALVSATESLTYAQLNERANQLARQLHALDVQPGQLVGLCLERTPALLITLLAILKAGAGFVPLDLQNPANRLAYMLQDTAVELIVAHVATLSDLSAVLRTHKSMVRCIVSLDAPDPTSSPDPHCPVRIEYVYPSSILPAYVPYVDLDHLAYVMYTSGSTGQPKGVAITHRNLAYFFAWTGQYFQLQPHDRVIQYHSLSFDFSIWEIFETWLVGASLHLVSYEAARDVEILAQVIQTQNISVLNMTPSQFTVLLDYVQQVRSQALESIRILVLGGEALSPTLVERTIDALPADCRIYNEYGPTEATISCSICLLSQEVVEAAQGQNSVSIGSPRLNMRLYVLDKHLRPVPQGIVGELYIGGEGLGWGYWQRADLTADRYLPDPLCSTSGARMYKTGDLVRWQGNGTFQFLRRVDYQVKLRGYRIELGEIEAVLNLHEIVRESTIIVHEDQAGEQQIVAYIACHLPQSTEPYDHNQHALYDQQISLWKHIFDRTYHENQQVHNPTFNIIGWNSSYTNQPLPEEDMHEWIEETIARIKSLHPQNIVEIGFGMGLLLFRLAPDCRSYYALDTSSEAFEYVQRMVTERRMTHVELVQQAAHQLMLPASSADLVIINSVVQFFPSITYLQTVIREAIQIVRPGGKIFLGDIRNLTLLEAFHTSVEVYHAPAAQKVMQIQQQVQQHILQESELVVDPAFFVTLRRELPQISHIDIQLKRGRCENELSRYRYDVTLWVQAPEQPAWHTENLSWLHDVKTISTFRTLVEQKKFDVLYITNVPNKRLQTDRVMIEIIKEERAGLTADALKHASLWTEANAALMSPVSGIDPEEIWQCVEDLPYKVYIRYAANGAIDCFDIVVQTAELPLPIGILDEHLYQHQPEHIYANNPLQNQQIRYLVPSLRRYVQQQLPEYMVPSAFIMLDQLPLTKNGKIDRKALPAPSHARPEQNDSFIAPRTAIEEQLSTIWAEVLGLDLVGINDNFFELGGHSLLATQIIAMVRQTFHMEVPLRYLFAWPTIAQLAPQLHLLQIQPKDQDTQEILLLPVARDRVLPLSYAQQRLWVIDQLGTGGGLAYGMVAAVRIHGVLNIVALEASLQQIVQRHEVLRTHIVFEDGMARQVIQENVIISLPVQDCSLHPVIAREQEIATQVQLEALKPFDLKLDLLLRTNLLRFEAQEHALLLSVHHIVADGWSVGVFVRELSAFYQAYVQDRPIVQALPELPIQYADYAVWQREWLSNERITRQLEYWRQQLQGAPTTIALPVEHSRPAIQRYRGAHYYFALPDELYQRLLAFSQQQGVTLFMTALAAFYVLLARYSGQSDLVIGTPIANRTHSGLEQLIGFFVNTLALRIDLTGNLAFRELLLRVQKMTLDAYAHQDVPFEMVVDALQPERTASYNPLFQVMFALQNALIPSLDLSGLRLEPVEVDSGIVKFDLSLTLSEMGQALHGDLGYNTDLFSATMIEQFVTHFLYLLECIVINPDDAIFNVSLLTTGEQQKLLALNNRQRSKQQPLCFVHQHIEQQVQLQPAALAIVDNNRRLSYQEMNQKANQLAHYLHTLSVGPEQPVALFMERSADAIIALLAIFKAGGVFVPLDVNHPSERLRLLLEAVQPTILLTKQHWLDDLPTCSATVVCIDEIHEQLNRQPEDNLLFEMVPEQLAYIVYTSGSTGLPKGVMNTQGSLADAYIAWQTFYQLDTFAPILLQQANLTFDVFVGDVVRALCSGGTLVICPLETRLIAERLYALLCQTGVNMTEFVPAVLRPFVQYLEETQQVVSAFRVLIVGSESWHGIEVQRIRAAFGEQTRIINSYGLSETTVENIVFDCSDAQLVEEHFVPIGRPFENTEAYILDGNMLPVPIGGVGELYLGGSALARGYLGRPDFTAERFIPHLFVGVVPCACSGPCTCPLSGERLYATGDLVRYLHGGSIEYLGRVDTQVKLRGLRIELGEIEITLQKHPSIDTSIVQVREYQGEKYIIAYIVGSASGHPHPTELRTFLQASLPSYMLPSFFVQIEHIPLNTNGKINWQALPEPEIKPDEGNDVVLPRTVLETFLSDMWQEVLEIKDAIGIYTTFFELGGDSIKAAIFINRLQDRLGIDLYIVAIFDASTIAELAKYLGERYPQIIGRFFGPDSLPDFASPPLAPVYNLASASIVDAEKIASMRSLIPQKRQTCYSETKNPPAIFVLSAPRSGTTLLRVMLGGHPQCFAPPELELLSFVTLQERKAAYEGRNGFWLEGTIRALMEIEGCDGDAAKEAMAAAERKNLTVQEFYQQLQSTIGNRCLVDKTTTYALDLSTLRSAEEIFAQPKYIHLVRHPQAMISSFEEMKIDQVFFRHQHSFPAHTLAELIWLVCHENICQFQQEIPAERYYRLYFEDLVLNPQKAMQDLCRFLEIEFHPDMIAPYKGQRMTDGIYTISKMLGDINFHQHQDIDPDVLWYWKEKANQKQIPLSVQTQVLASLFGYPLEAVSVDRASTPFQNKTASIPLKPRGEAYQDAIPLSFAQQRLWVLDRLTPESTAYSMPAVVRLQGALDFSVLQQCIDEIVRRHEVLRTHFVMVNRSPLQVIDPKGQAYFEVVNLQNVLENNPEYRKYEHDKQIEQLIKNRIGQPFDLQQGSLLRLHCIQIDKETSVLLVNMHHIISDGWSLGIFLRELATLYENLTTEKALPLPVLPIQYADFALWQRKQLSGETLTQLLSYWKSQFATAPHSLSLPLDYPRPALQSFRGVHHVFTLPQALSAQLKVISQQHGVTLFMTLLSAFNVLLMRYSSQEDIVVGSPVANRTRTDLERLIGFFVNMLALRIDMTDNPPFSTLLRRVQKIALAAYDHQDLPFEQLVDEIIAERSLDRSPLFQVVFALQNTPMPSLTLPGLQLQPLAIESNTTKFDITLTMTETNGSLLGVVEYSTDLFKTSSIQRLVCHFETLLTSIVADPEQYIWNLQILSREERQQLLIGNNNQPSCFPELVPLHALFEQQVRHSPTAPALLFSARGQKLTYKDLNEQANQLACFLQQNGVARGVRVGLFMERSIEVFVGLLAILKAGGVFVPLDVNDPLARQRYLLEDTQLKLILTHAQTLPYLTKVLSEEVGTRIDVEEVFCFDEPSRPANLPASIRYQSRAALDKSVTPAVGGLAQGSDARQETTLTDLAYIMYTSGSTGWPKGVGITHENLAYFFAWARRYFQIQPADRTIQYHSLSFDFSIWEVFETWLTGAALVVVSSETARDVEILTECISHEQVSILNMTSSQCSALLDYIQQQGCAHLLSGLRILVLGGEVLSPSLAERVLSLLPNCQIYNEYGPTEATISCSIWPVTMAAVQESKEQSSVPIGRPRSDMQLYILDRIWQPVAVGIPGELYIGGDGLGWGYWQRPDLTAGKYIPDPFGSKQGGRLYRTGDLAFWREDGTLQFIGRVDYQVKLRGYRIELGEIEAVLNQHPLVHSSIVVVQGETAQEQSLVAYVVFHSHLLVGSHSLAKIPGNVDDALTKEQAVSTLRLYLHHHLPAYALPASFVVMDHFALSTNGKVDRKALPQPDRSRPDLDNAYVAPRTPLEAMIAKIWMEVLGMDQPGPGIHDNFFIIGGHSLLATQITARIEDVSGFEIPLRSVFEASTIASWVEWFENMQKSASSHSGRALQRQIQTGDVPLAFAQERLWFIAQLEQGTRAYNVPSALRIKGGLDGALLERSINLVIERQAVLRSTFIEREGLPVLIIKDHLLVSLVLRDLTEIPDEDRKERLSTLARQEILQSFDLSQGPLLRLGLYRVANDEYIFLLNMHHIVTDGWSMGIFVREVATCYETLRNGHIPLLPALPIQYTDYASWQRQQEQDGIFAKQLRYWMAVLEDVPPFLNLPFDHSHLAQERVGASVAFSLSTELSSQLRSLSRRENVTLFMTLLTAFAILLYRYTGQDDLVIGTSIAGRTRPVLEDLIGLFVNTLALRSDLSGNPGVHELLARVREVALGAYANQDVPFEKVVEALNPVRSLSFMPLFQIFFVLQNAPAPVLELPDLVLTPLEAEHDTTKFALLLSMRDGEQLSGDLEYDAGLFDRATIERLVCHLQTILAALVADSRQHILDIPFLSEKDQLDLLALGRGPQMVIPPDQCIHDLIEMQVKRSPESLAVLDTQERLTYQKLDAMAEQVAYLLQLQNIQPEARIGVCMERGVKMIAALLGIFKAGGVYVPLDPNYPSERLAFMISNAQMDLVLVSEQYQSIFSSFPVSSIGLDDLAPIAEATKASLHKHKSDPEQIAYIIYTSGSTGHPKGVAIRHRAAVTLCYWTREVFSERDLSGMLATASQSFDLSIFEFLAPLAWGGTTIMMQDIWQFIEDTPDIPIPVTLINIVPSGVNQLLTEKAIPETVGTINLVGEALSREIVQRVYQETQAERIYNLYGPSEDTTYSTGGLVSQTEQKQPAIGRPLTNTHCFVLDEQMHLVPQGAIGELYLGGAGLARGYINRPDLTAERFLPNPFVGAGQSQVSAGMGGERLYRTGDLVRYRNNGEIEYVGRIDYQIKIRGFRVETSEIESILQQHPLLREAVVLAQEDGRGNKFLVAYVATAREVSSQELVTFLHTRLPDYMIPTGIVRLEHLPLTRNGKLDRTKLPPYERKDMAVEETVTAPRDEIEQKLVALWRSVLQVEAIGIYDNFFELGGHSLMATQLVSQIRLAFGFHLPLRALFDTPTIAGIAAIIADEQDTDQTIEDLLQELETLSEEELQQLLSETGERDK